MQVSIFGLPPHMRTDRCRDTLKEKLDLLELRQQRRPNSQVGLFERIPELCHGDAQVFLLVKDRGSYHGMTIVRSCVESIEDYSIDENTPPCEFSIDWSDDTIH